MARLNHRLARFEIKSAAGEPQDGSTFEGWGGVYLNLDSVGDILDTGACGHDIAFTKAEGKIKNEHCHTTGRITDARDEPSKGLYIKGAISATSHGLDQRILVQDAVLDRLSIGYEVLAREWLDAPEAVLAFWESKGYKPTEDDMMNLARFGGARLIKRAKVYEVSTTWLPANDEARITAVKSDGPHAGHSLDHHFSRVLATVEELLERTGQVQSLRAADGRTLATKTQALLGRLSGRLAELAAATEPPAEAQAEADLALFDRYLHLGERLRGAI